MFKGRLTFANVVSFLALFVALSASSYAAIALPKNSVGSKQIKANAVSTPKIKAHAVTGTKIATDAIDTTKVRDGSLTGADLNLTTLGKVPAAAAADTAGSAPIERVKIVAVGGTASTSGAAATATCDPGLFLVGGGASVADQANEIINDSYPASNNTWAAHAFAGSSGGTGFTVYALCAPVVATQ